MRYAASRSCKAREKLSAWRRQCSEHECREGDDKKGEGKGREWAVAAWRKEMSGFCAGYRGRECLVVRETVWLGEGGSVLARSNEGGLEGA